MPARTSTESHPQLYGFPLILYSLLIRVAATLVGQFFLHVADRVLWTVENLTYWSIPTHRLAEFANAPQTPLVRPLSWWLFLPGLLWLRLIRKGVSVVLWFIGSEPVTPISMVYYVQTQRNNIQSIQQTGAQTIRKRREESAKKAGKIRGLWIKLQKLIHLKFLHFEEEEEVKVIRPRKSPSDEKKEESSGEETELTLAELLEKYTNMEDDEVNDPDYVPDEEESSTEDSSEDEDVNADALAKALLEESQELLNKSFICETPKLPIGGNYPRSKTPPIRDYSNTHHPSGSLQSEDRAKYTFPISSQYPNPESENDSIGSETKAPKHTTSSGTSSPNKTTQSKELKKKDSDQNQEIF